TNPNLAALSSFNHYFAASFSCFTNRDGTGSCFPSYSCLRSHRLCSCSDCRRDSKEKVEGYIHSVPGNGRGSAPWYDDYPIGQWGRHRLDLSGGHPRETG